MFIVLSCMALWKRKSLASRSSKSVANAVIIAENACLKGMNTNQLLDLFTSAPTARKGSVLSSSSNGDLGKDSKSMVGGRGLKAILSGLEERWDQSQYADEYNLSHFLAKLNGQEMAESGCTTMYSVDRKSASVGLMF